MLSFSTNSWKPVFDRFFNLSVFLKIYRYLFLLIGLGIFLLGCSAPQAETPISFNASPSAPAIELLTPPTPQELTPRIHPTLTATPLPTVDPTATLQPETSICSPLFSTTLSDLASIISDGFHPPPAGQDGRHQGVDFAYYRKFGRDSIAGEIVQAILAGSVAASIRDRFPYGNVVIVETPFILLPTWVKELLKLTEDESLYVLYAHLAELYPSEIGGAILTCQALGTVGKSGNAGVAHLHLELRIGKAAQIFPSMSYYVTDATPEERQTYLWWRTSGEFRAIDPMLILVVNE